MCTCSQSDHNTVVRQYTSFLISKVCGPDLDVRAPSLVRSGGRAVDRRTVYRGDGGSIQPAAVSKLRQFRLPHICLCLSEETLKAGGPFYLVSMPGEVKDPTQGVRV